MERIRAVHGIMRSCDEKTATTLPIAKEARTEYSGGRADGSGHRKLFLFTVGPTIQKSSRGKNSRRKFLPKTLMQTFLPPIIFGIVMYAVVQDMIQ